GFRCYRHMRMGSVHTRQTRPPTRANSDDLIVSVMLTTPRIIATYRDVVHSATAGRGDAIGTRLMQSPKDHIDDALRGLDIATSHGAREGAVDHTTGIGDDVDGGHTAIVEWKLLLGQGANAIVHRRHSDGE